VGREARPPGVPSPSLMQLIERFIRRAAMCIIAIFAIAFVAFVFAMLVDDGDFLLRFYGPKRLLEILAGPVVAFITLMIIIIRARKDADAGGSRNSFIALLTFGVALVSVFRAYGRKYGRDAWVLLFLLSGTWSLMLLWIVVPRGEPTSACPACGSIRLPYLLFMSGLWAWLGISLWRAAAARARPVG
jgi:hypothetical protein